MLLSVSLKCFRRHKDLTIDFTDGLNVFRAPNEQGKTTVIEAVCYAFFGAGALRDTLAETVTWEHKESELGVILNYRSGPKTYKFTRAKSGASVFVDGSDKPYVTGQKEVTAFAAQILGADPKMAPRLMFADQGAMKGALSQGSAATADMLEDLAGLTLFDEIIKAMQDKLLIGPTTILDERLARADLALAEMPVPTPPDLKAFKDLTKAHELELEAKNAELKLARDAAQEAYTARQLADHQEITYKRLKADLSKAEQTLAVRILQRDNALAISKTAPDPELTSAAQAELVKAQSLAKTKADYSNVSRLIAAYPTVSWDEGRSTFDARITELEKLVPSVQAKLNKLRQDIRVWQSKIVTASICQTCGQDVSKSDTIASSNAALQLSITSAKESEVKVSSELCDLEDEQTVMRGIQRMAGSYDVAATISGVTADTQFVPVKLIWSDPIPPDNVDTTEIENRISALNERANKAGRAKGQVEVLEQSIQDDRGVIAGTEAKLIETPEPHGIEQLRDASNRAAEYVISVESQAVSLSQGIQKLANTLQSATHTYNSECEELARLKRDVETSRKELASLQFNNALLKKIRTIRPIVANKLWASVMGAISSMFTSMRGEQSVISKSKDGFRCNDHSVASLSGSALDLLGLAIRVALLKTFIPHCSFMTLDEPAAACNQERTESLLAFVAASGFEQIVMVTHDEIAESVATTLHTL